MTVVDAQVNLRQQISDSRESRPVDAASSDAVLTSRGVEVIQVPDMGAGRGPLWLDRWLEANTSDVLAWRRYIHANPELSRQEHGTTEFVMTLLRSVGLKPWMLPCGTGVVCDVGTGDRCVALRADIDALAIKESTGLPFSSTVDGVSHACGHDAHTTILLATAMALASAPELPGRIRLIFQPSEEVVPGGAQDVIAAGGLTGVERIFGLHCDPRTEVGYVGTRVGPITSATDFIELRLTSPGGHTSRPHLTADLVHALGMMITSLPSVLSRRVDPRSGTVLVWGAVHAGEAANAVPEIGVLRGTLRTGDREVWKTLKSLVTSSVEALLAPTGVGFSLTYEQLIPPVINDAVSTQMLQDGVAEALGVQALVDTAQSSGGEDFGWYVEQIPGSYARLGVWPGEGPQRDIHRPNFELDERALLVGTRIMVHAALTALA